MSNHEETAKAWGYSVGAKRPFGALAARSLERLAAAALVLLTATCLVAARAVDYRIIVIDNALYSAIPAAADRNKALDYLLRDIAMFEDDGSAARIATVVYMRSTLGVRLEEVINRPAGKAVGTELAATQAFGDMRNGAVTFPPGIDVNELRNRLHGFFSLNRGTIDLHIFATSWTTSFKTEGKFDLMHAELPSVCIAKLDSKPALVPEDIELTFEFRAPEASELPSEPAQANLIALVAGSAEEQPNVLSRGAAGPLCDLGDGKVAAPFNPDPNGEPDCTGEAQISGLGRYVACRAPPMMSAGAVDMTPVRLVVADLDLEMPDAELQVGAMADALELQVAFITAPASRQIPLTGVVAPGTYGVLLAVRPSAGCRPGQPLDARISTSTGRAMQVAVAELPCSGTISLGDVEVP